MRRFLVDLFFVLFSILTLFFYFFLGAFLEVYADYHLDILRSKISGGIILSSTFFVWGGVIIFSYYYYKDAINSSKIDVKNFLYQLNKVFFYSLILFFSAFFLVYLIFEKTTFILIIISLLGLYLLVYFVVGSYYTENCFDKFSFVFYELKKNFISLFILVIIFNLLMFFMNRSISLFSKIIYLSNYLFLVTFLALFLNLLLFNHLRSAQKKLADDKLKAILIYLIKISIGLSIVVLFPSIRDEILISIFFASLLFKYFKKKSENFLLSLDRLSVSKNTITVNPSNELLNFLSSGNVMTNTANIMANSPFVTNFILEMVNFSIDTKKIKLASNSIHSVLFKLDSFFKKDFSEGDYKISFNQKVDFIVDLVHILINNGRKALPAFLIAYLVYLYKEPDIEQKKYLINRIKSVINNKTFNTPRRMVEFLLSWQFIYKHYYNMVPSIKRIPSFVKKKLKKVFENYSPLTLRKNKLLNRSIKLKDLIKLLHPKPKDNINSVIYGSIIQDTKFSKIPQQENVLYVISNEDVLIEKINVLPIQALIRNISKVNFENTRVFMALEQRLNDLISNIHNIKRFINIFDLFIPLFSIPKNDIIKIFNIVKNRKLGFIIPDKIKKFSIESVIDIIGNVSLESLDLANITDLDKIQKISALLEFMINLEEFISINWGKVDFSLYHNAREIKGRERLKYLLNKALDTYFQNNRIDNLVNIFVVLSNEFSYLSKIITFLTSIYSNFKLIIVEDNLIDYTDQYKEITKNLGPIDKQLKSYCLFVELYRIQKSTDHINQKSTDQHDVYRKYGLMYEYIVNNSLVNTIILDSNFNLPQMIINLSYAFEERNFNNNIAIFKYNLSYNLPCYCVNGNLHFINSNLNPFVFEIINNIFSKKS